MREDEIPVGRAKDLRGKKFGKLTVLYRVANKNRNTMWKCQCECGNTTIVFAGNLLSNQTTSCGCKKFSRYGEDLVGMVFNRLTVLEKSEKICATGSMWECQCECGNIVTISRNHLVTGHTNSCGCFRADQTSLANSAKIPAGTRFGKLVIIKEAYKRNLLTFWECKCDCGNTTYVPTGHLNSGHTQSCGCLSSQGEHKISIIFNEKNIDFTTQQSFDSCQYENSKRPPRFDFYVDNSYLIEYDGQQHFYPIDHFGGEEQFKIQQERDAYKNQWCKENNIPLIRIPYTKLDTLTIEDLMLETTQFRVV